VGKTTVLTKTVDELRRRGFKVGGVVSSEFRKNGERVGFKIVDLGDGREGWLASIRQHTGPRIGKYLVCLEDIESVGAKAIQNAVAEADVVVIDEVGPMELLSLTFRDAIVKALDSGKPVLGTIHHNATLPLVTAIKKRTDVKIIEVTTSNRDELPALVTQEISEVSEKT
jgi:nucleoside-triphosphatase